MTVKLPPPPPAKATPPPATGKYKRIEAKPGRYRIIVNCAEGWGKTTLLAACPNPLLIMAPNESGFVTLRQSNRVADVPCVQPTTLDELIAVLRDEDVRGFATVCLDAMGGFVDMIAAEVLKNQFSNDPQKFASYGKGQSVVESEWLRVLSALESLPVSVVIASHAEIQNFANPEGDNYSRFVGDTPKAVWAATKRWADAVLFGTFYTAVQDGKGKGGTDRVLYTEHRASHDAKNRWGMPAMLKMPNDPAKVYDEVFKYIPAHNSVNKETH